MLTLMITIDEYWMGRNRTYAEYLTAEIERNAGETVARVNALLAAMSQDGLNREINPETGSQVSSGWRPPAVNATTRGAARRSKHMTGLACDLYDPEGTLDEWCLDHPARLAEIGLWQEHPSATKGWLHVQTVPPKSGKRVFYP